VQVALQAPPKINGMSLQGRVVLISGASGGIGSVTARAFAARGATLVLAALDDPALHAVGDVCAHLGSSVRVVPMDITRRGDIDRLVADALVAFGRIDVLVNVAGVGSPPSICDSTDAELERVVAVNLLGPARLMHAVLPSMIAQRRGTIVNVGSVAGEAGVMGIYSASKFGLRGLTDSVRREVRSHNVRITLVAPGFVQTTMNPRMHGLPGPEIVADAIVDAVDRPRRINIVPRHYQIGVMIARAFPGFTDLVFGDARIQRRLNRDARAEREAVVG